MRTALAVCLAVALFASAALWHADRQGAARQVRADAPEAERASPENTGPGSGAPDGWVEIILGAPSGAEPIEVPVWYVRRGAEQSGSSGAPATTGEGPGPQGARAGGYDAAPPRLSTPLGPTPTGPPDFELEVGAGQILGRISLHQYGTSRPRLVDALARYNGLASPDKLREGQVLRLPPLEILEALAAAAPDRP